MRIKAIYSVLVFLSFIILCKGFTFDDLRSINGSCHEFGSCSRGVGFRLDHRLDEKDPYCYCDDKCLEYGDCCLSAKSYDETKIRNYERKFKCVTHEITGGFYMRDTCHKNWENKEIQELCLKAKPNSGKLFEEDPFLHMPVTSLESDITYTNYYCSLCNFESPQNIEIWRALMNCPPVVSKDTSFIQENVKFIDNSWGVYQEPDENFIKCSLIPTPKDTVSHKLRRCKEHIDTCSPLWEVQSDKELCNSYMNIVYGPSPSDTDSADTDLVAYRNYHCALCNFVQTSDIDCYVKDLREIAIVRFSPVSFSVLFDFGKKSTNCDESEIWDPLNKNCRRVFCLNESSKYKNGKCVKNFGEVEKESVDMNSTLKCDKIFINETDFVEGENGTITSISLRRTYTSDEYETAEYGFLICIPQRYSKLMGWLTFVGLGISCICILLHILVFAILPEMRNLSGKNLICLCLSLLIAYICFLISSFNIFNTYDCLYLSYIMYYFFLASFTWVSVMAFDIWRTLQRATSQLRLSSGKQWKKYFLYSVYAWSVPLIFLIFVVSVDYLKPKWMDPSYLPELGANQCWFGQANGIIIYFAAPLAVIMIMNMLFFALSVRIVAFSRRSTDTVTGTQAHKGQLKLYLRLALLMGLSWISGIVAGYVQEERLWYIFILLNAFQGLYILLGFTCSEKVSRALRNKIPFTKLPKRSSKYEVKSHGMPNTDSNATQLSNISSSSISSNNLKNDKM